jgi:hypothetical protein
VSAACSKPREPTVVLFANLSPLVLALCAPDKAFLLTAADNFCIWFHNKKTVVRAQRGLCRLLEKYEMPYHAIIHTNNSLRGVFIKIKLVPIMIAAEPLSAN